MERAEEGGGTEEDGECQPPASSNYQCEWSVAASAMGLIRTPLNGTRSPSSSPTGRLPELNPTPTPA